MTNVLTKSDVDRTHILFRVEQTDITSCAERDRHPPPGTSGCSVTCCRLCTSAFLILFVMFYFSASIVHGFVTEHSLFKVAPQEKKVGMGGGRGSLSRQSLSPQILGDYWILEETASLPWILLSCGVIAVEREGGEDKTVQITGARPPGESPVASITTCR